VPEPAEPEGTPSPAREFAEVVRSPSPPVRNRSEVPTLQYKVLIHLTGVEEEFDIEERLFQMGSPGSGQSGIPEDDFDVDRRRFRSLPWRLGVPDARGKDSGAGQVGPHGHVAAVVRSDWRLPAVLGPPPLVAVQERTGQKVYPSKTGSGPLVAKLQLLPDNCRVKFGGRFKLHVWFRSRCPWQLLRGFRWRMERALLLVLSLWRWPRNPMVVR
jgi:hypothetical protein